jgi:hypothetical protein
MPPDPAPPPWPPAPPPAPRSLRTFALSKHPTATPRARDDPPGGEILNSWRHLGGVEARGAPAAGELGASPPARLAPDRRIWRRGRDPSEEERRMGPWWPSPPRRGHGSAAGERLHPWEGAARASRPHLRRAAARAWWARRRRGFQVLQDWVERGGGYRKNLVEKKAAVGDKDEVWGPCRHVTRPERGRPSGRPVTSVSVRRFLRCDPLSRSLFLLPSPSLYS